MKGFIPLVPVALLLGACAGSEPRFYDAAEAPGEAGFSEVRLDENRYRVSYTGDTSMSEEVVRELALMRAAELTSEEGYDWFRVMAEESREDLAVRQLPEETTIVSGEGDTTVITRDEEGGAVVYQDCGPLGCTTTATEEYRGGDLVITREDGHISTTLEIQMGEGEVMDPTVVYNADALYDYLEQRYVS